MIGNTYRKLIAVVGPTASGKTGIGVQLAKDFNGEIVSADSRQVYRGLDIGTGKDLEEYDGIKYHLIDVVDPGEKFALFDYLLLARTAIEDIFSRGKVPIIVGGTGLYVQALTQGFVLERNQNAKIKMQNYSGHSVLGLYKRDQLNNKSVEELQDILQELDIKAYEILADPKNPHRLIRAIEKVQEGLKPTKTKPDFEVLQIGITWPREELYDRIDKRVDSRFEQGMLSEVENLLKAGVGSEWLLNLGLEYKIMASFLISNSKFLITNENEKLETKELIKNWKLEIKNYDEMRQVLKYKIHQFAKRQSTWFRRFSEIVWENDYEKIKKKVEKFLN